MHRQQHNPQEVDDLLPAVCGTLRLSGPHSERMPILLLQLSSRLLSLLGQTLKMISFFTSSQPPSFLSRRQIKTNFHIHNQPSHSTATSAAGPTLEANAPRTASTPGICWGDTLVVPTGDFLLACVPKVENCSHSFIRFGIWGPIICCCRNGPMFSLVTSFQFIFWNA